MTDGEKLSALLERCGPVRHVLAVEDAEVQAAFAEGRAMWIWENRATGVYEAGLMRIVPPHASLADVSVVFASPIPDDLANVCCDWQATDDVLVALGLPTRPPWR